MVEPAEVGLAALAVFGASEATGVTDITGLGGGGGGGSDSDSGSEGSPPVDLSGLRASVSELGGRVAANAAASTFDRPSGGGVDLSGLAAGLAANSAGGGGSEPVTTIIGDTARATTGGVRDGITDGFTETTGIDTLTGGGPGGGGGGGSREPFAGFEETGRTAGENIGSGLGGGAGNVIGVGVESAGNAILRPYREQIRGIQEQVRELPTAVRDNGQWFPNDPLTNVARNRTPGENIDVQGLLNSDGPTDSSSGSGFLNDITSDGRLDSPLIGGDSGSAGPSNVTSDTGYGAIQASISGSESEAEAGGDPAADPAEADAPGRNDRMDRMRERIDRIGNGSRRSGVV